MDLLLKAFASVVGGAAVLCNLPVSWWMPAERATLNYLSKATLKKLDGSNTKFEASTLWSKGAVAIMAEAQRLSSLRPQLDSHGVKLYAVVHEEGGVKQFQEFFKGEIFLDIERKFYGPKERWMFLSGFLRPGIWLAGYNAWKQGVQGNLKGEGRLLGGVFLIGPEEMGILLEHRESEFGDTVNVTQLMEIVNSKL